jgi:hypothetical protein
VFIVVGLYVVNTPPGVEDGAQVNSLDTLPDNITTLPQDSPLPQPPDKDITLPLPVKAVADVVGLNEILDADDMSFVYDDSPPQNVGELLDADDMSFVYDDSPHQNVGAALDVDPMAFFYENSLQQNVGKALDADAQ